MRNIQHEPIYTYNIYILYIYKSKFKYTRRTYYMNAICIL